MILRDNACVHFFDLISIKACEDKSHIVNKSGDDISFFFRKSEKIVCGVEVLLQ